MAPKPRAAKFPQLAKKILADYWSFHPETATAWGLHRFDGKLGAYRKESLRAFATRIHENLGRLDRVAKADGLSANARLELGVLRSMLLSELSELEDQRLPNTLPFYWMVRLNIVNYLLRNYATIDRRLRSIGKLQSEVPRYLEDFRHAADRHLAETFYEVGAMAAAGILDAYTHDLPEQLSKASTAVRSFVEGTNEKAIAALKTLIDDLERNYKPAVKEDFALGRSKFGRMIYAEHLAKIPIERLLEVGHADLRANEATLAKTAKRIDPSKSPAQVLEGIEVDHPTPESLIDDTREMLEQIRSYLVERDIITLPSEQRALVLETPRFFRWATAALNPPGGFEKAATDAFYYVTPVEESWDDAKKEEWLRHLNYTSLRNISVHECYPGHFVHFLHYRRVKSAVLRSYFSYAFTEGWAHYCEEMMVRQGFGDERLQLAQLQDALLRNCRYISSIMMHTGGWSWEDATRFFMEHAHLDRLPAEREAKRGTWDPGYLNYTLGKLMIKKLSTDWFRRNKGASLREFHDALLALGAPPLGLVREHLLGPDAGPAL